MAEANDNATAPIIACLMVFIDFLVVIRAMFCPDSNLLLKFTKKRKRVTSTPSLKATAKQPVQKHTGTRRLGASRGNFEL